MEDCDKHKAKAAIGFILFLVPVFMPILKSYLEVGLLVSIIIIIFSGVAGIMKLLPYIKCLSENNKKLKPPFSQ